MIKLAAFVSRFARNRSRGAIVLQTALVSLFARGFSIVASLLTVPIVLHHLGTEHYGVWMAAIALSTWFTMADSGVSKGLIAQVSQAHGLKDRERIRILVGSAMALTAGFCSLFFLMTLLAVRIVDWKWAFNLPTQELGREAGSTILIICAGYGLSFPVTVVRETRLGLMQGHAANIWDLGGTVLGFAGVLFVVWLGYGLEMIALVWVGGPLLGRIVASLFFFAGQGRDLVPSWQHVQLRACRSLLRAGSAFLVYMLATMLAVQSDQILIAHLLGPDAVADYSIVQRLFNQPQILAGLFLTAQWPAYGEALGRRDFNWISRHFKQTLLGFVIGSAVLCLPLGVFCGAILHVWVGDAIVASPLLVTAMAIYGVVAVVANVFSFFFMSLELYRPLVLTQSAMAACNLPLSIFLIKHVGSSGAIIGTTAGYLFALILPGAFILRRRFASFSTGAAGADGAAPLASA